MCAKIPLYFTHFSFRWRETDILLVIRKNTPYMTYSERQTCGKKHLSSHISGYILLAKKLSLVTWNHFCNKISFNCHILLNLDTHMIAIKLQL